MKIKRIKVEKLFGLDDNDFDIECYPNEYVTILYAFNGVGKTTILRLMDAVLNVKMQIIDSIPFKKIQILFDNDDSVLVEKLGDYKNTFATTKVKDLFELNGEPIYPIHYSVTMDNESKKYCLRFSEELKNSIKDSSPEEKIKFRKKTINTLFFHYENIMYFNEEDLKRFEFLYSDLIKRISSQGIFANKDYNRLLSDSITFESSVFFLDQKFASPIFENYNSTDTIYFSRKELGKIWLDDTKADSTNPAIPKDEMEYLIGQKNSKYPYKMEDKTEQLCRNIAKKLKENTDSSDLRPFIDLINKEFGFMYKNIELDEEKGLKVVPIYANDPVLEVSRLSSGEKNLIILFYELIFCSSSTTKNKQSIVFIDEPETSLHIDWQQNLIKNIMKICKDKDIQVIVATHSPDIVDEYWGLQSEMISARFKK